MEKLMNYFKASWAEIKKVSWPTKKETINYTILVIIISLGVAILLGALDALFSWGVQLIINKNL